MQRQWCKIQKHRRTQTQILSSYPSRLLSLRLVEQVLLGPFCGSLCSQFSVCWPRIQIDTSNPDHSTMVLHSTISDAIAEKFGCTRFLPLNDLNLNHISSSKVPNWDKALTHVFQHCIFSSCQRLQLQIEASQNTLLPQSWAYTPGAKLIKTFFSYRCKKV